MRGISLCTAAGALTDEETVQWGAVPMSVYLEYLQAAGGLCRVGLCVFMMVGGALLMVLSNVWLSNWADKRVQTTTGISLCVFAALGAAHVVVSVLSYLNVSEGTVTAARHFHEQLLRSILDAPMKFFDMTPTGRLLNRLTKSIYGIDEALPSALLSYVTTLITCLLTLSVISVVFPSFLLVVIPLLFYYASVQNFYVPTSRQLQRIETVSRSPVISHFQETLEGTETIRAYREEARFFAVSAARLDANSKIYYMSIAANRWLAVRLELVGAAVVCSSALFAVLGRGIITGGLGGLAVSYALSVTQQLNWLVRMASDRETAIVSVERVRDYSEGIDAERLEPTVGVPPSTAAGQPVFAATAATAAAAGAERSLVSWREKLPEGWPLEGAVEVRDLCVRYRPDLPLVLKGISFCIRSGERVGLVGRTGAGKSSLLVSLLRLVEPCGGSILIDGVDIQTVGLRFLRSRFAIIPQDPVLFEGSLRFNVDAQGEHSDEEIWQALEGAHLASAVRAMAERHWRRRSSSVSSVSRGSTEGIAWNGSQGEQGLEAAMLPAAEEPEETAAAAAIDVALSQPEELNPLDLMVEEGGRNFSLGQRQLICLARALLRRSRILLLDEATAVVDPRTDRLIQETIRKDFRECTVITIAHRIDTIVNYDRVLVLSEGRVEEFDSPRVLYNKKDSFFRSLCLQARVQPDRA
ncbi:canalicular multispecific organic anion transporter 2 [Cyclospora cayetanensis]|uniref:Canalicular multispecific organic anion transporter 2 n=1 Tax=Cyclospora cayetanensis TaxID=88456 RepID=A0A6P6S0U1_9EIME|nr:canalicular multispecific organic anion transporter 2 [Cyclospora cayetanensis]